MSDHVITNIRNAIRYGFGTIQSGVNAGDGYIYKRSINHIAKPIEDPEQFSQLDAVVILLGDDICNNQNSGSHTQSGANKAVLENTIDVTFINFMQEPNDIELAQENKLADIQKYFGMHYYIPSSSGVRTCFNTIYTGSRMFGYSATRPNCGIEIRFKIWYRQQFDDPTILV